MIASLGTARAPSNAPASTRQRFCTACRRTLSSPMVANLARFAVVLGVAAVFVIAARWITWEQMDMSATRCPAGRGEANARAAIAAYEAIAEDLARGNTDDVGRRATVI